VVPGWSAPAAVGAWFGVAVLAAVLVLLARRAAGGAVLLALTLAAYGPVSGLVPVYPAVADRVLFGAEHFLYLPLAGLVPLVAGAWPAQARRVAPVVVLALLCAWGWLTIDRNRDWRDEETLFRRTIAFDPPTARVWYNLANLRLAAGDLDEAERLYRSALARAPNDADAHWNLGITLQRKGRALAALAEYREAVRLDPRLAAKLGTPGASPAAE
jgi:tetratricopeptide (TPR) repeat protein